MARACSKVFRNPCHRRKAIRESRIRLAGDRNSSKMESFNGGVRDTGKRP